MVTQRRGRGPSRTIPVRDEVKEALGRAAHADVRYVQSTLDRPSGRIRVEVGIRPWHDEATVLGIIQAVPGLKDVTGDGVGVITGFRTLENDD